MSRHYAALAEVRQPARAIPKALANTLRRIFVGIELSEAVPLPLARVIVAPHCFYFRIIMPTIYQLKSRFQDLLRPLCKRLASAGVTANQVTLLALVLSIAEGLALWVFPGAFWPLILLPVILFVRMGLNAIDGMLAREHDQKSDLGAILNELGDVLSDAALYLPFAALPVFPGELVVGLVVLAIIGEMTGVIALQIGASRRYDGPFGKSDRAALFGLCGVLLAFGLTSELFFTILMGLGVLLSAVTIWNRAKNALGELETQ